MANKLTLKLRKDAFRNKSTQVSISVPVGLRKKMIRLAAKGDKPNWSAVATEAIREYINKHA